MPLIATPCCGEVSALSTSREDLLDTEGRAPIIRLVNHLLFDAVKAGASDVHIQPYEDRVMVRQRIDGVLFDSFEIPKSRSRRGAHARQSAWQNEYRRETTCRRTGVPPFSWVIARSTSASHRCPPATTNGIVIRLFG